MFVATALAEATRAAKRRRDEFISEVRIVKYDKIDAAQDLSSHNQTDRQTT